MRGNTISQTANDIAYAMAARFDVSYDVAETISYDILVSMLERKIGDVPFALAAAFESKCHEVSDFDAALETASESMRIVN